MPRIITIFQSCVKHNIPDKLISTLHFNDLYLLLMSLDEAELRLALRQKKMERNKSKNENEVELTPEDAVKFMKGGI